MRLNAPFFHQSILNTFHDQWANFKKHAISPWEYILFAVALSGCTNLHYLKQDAVSPSSNGEVRLERILIDEGIKKLQHGKYSEASIIFNAGLKFDNSNAPLHFLNALSYHLQYLRGNAAAQDLAVTGYELALEADPAHYLAALQLGRLQFDAKRFDAAAAAFKRGIDIDPSKGNAFLGLAASKYYSQDLKDAAIYADKAKYYLPNSAEAARFAAIIHAAMGNESNARKEFSRYAALETDARLRARTSSRIEQWHEWHTATNTRTMSAPLPPHGLAVAQANPFDTLRTPSPNNLQDKENSLPSESPDQQNQGKSSSFWFDCEQNRAFLQEGASTMSMQASGSSSDDVIQPMPRLPTPCPGFEGPRMALLDVTFIRTGESGSSSQGFNLLQNLSYVFNVARSLDDVLTQNSDIPDTRQITITRRRSGQFNNTVGGNSGGVAYSLNIANSTGNRAEVLAQPSLVALDRMPSTFFSGRNVSLGIVSQGGGTSSVTDRPIGIGISVTPTFIDSDSMLLAVRAQRSFVEAVDVNIAFGQALQTSRNSVSANVLLKMGQTLILSGLTEREVQSSSDGVPVLKDIPGIQYLFNNTSKLNYTSSVLILITPRPPPNDKQLMNQAVSHIGTLTDPGNQRLQAAIEKNLRDNNISIPSNIKNTYAHTLGNKLFLQFRAGDLTLQDWSTPTRLNSLIQDLKQMLHY